jgi:hypothetical protein
MRYGFGFLLFLLSMHAVCWAQTNSFQGTLSDAQGEPLPFAGLIFKGQTWEIFSSTDLNGRFRLAIPRDASFRVYLDLNRKKKCILVHKKSDSLEVDLRLSKKLEHELRTVSVLPSPDETMPNFVMKQAIQRRNLNLNRMGSFTMWHRVSSKSRVTNTPPAYPRLWLWDAVPDTHERGTRFFLQYFSELNSQPSAGVHSELVSDFRMFGQPESYALQSAQFSEIHLYRQRIWLNGFAEFPFVSPLSWDAFFYYRFSGSEWYYKGGQKVYVIHVLPRNRNSPTFHGEIEIAEGNWDVVNFKLTAGKKAGLVLVDSVKLEFQQQAGQGGHVPAKRVVLAWKKFYGAALTFDWTSEVDSVKSWGAEQERETKRRFSMPINALNFDSVFFSRHFQAEEVEFQKICEMDSLLNSSHFKGIVRPGRRGIGRQFEWYHPILGGNFRDYAAQTAFGFDGLFNEQFEINTVEGPTYKWGCSFNKRFEGGWEWSVSPKLRYGFSDQEFKAKVKTELFSRRKGIKLTLAGGSYVFQINSSEPINHYINTLYTLFYRQNFMKLYRKAFLSWNYEQEVINGLYVQAGAEYAIRSTLENNFSWSISSLYGGSFTPNNPNSTSNPGYELINNAALILRGGLTFRPQQRYIRYLGDKHVLNGKGIELSVFMDAGVPGFLNSDVSYLRWLFSLRNEFNLGLFGRSSLLLRSGWMAFANRLTYLDFTHFLGDQTYFLGNARERVSLDQFRGLGYYTYSTRGSYFEGHWQHDFEHTLLKEVPLLRALRWNYLVGANVLMMADALFTPYTEVFFGIDRLLAAVRPLEMFNLRLDLAMQVNESGFQPPMILLGIGSNFHKVPR